MTKKTTYVANERSLFVVVDELENAESNPIIIIWSTPFFNFIAVASV